MTQSNKKPEHKRRPWNAGGKSNNNTKSRRRNIQDSEGKIQLTSAKLIHQIDLAMNGNYGSSIPSNPKNDDAWNQRWADIVYNNRIKAKAENKLRSLNERLNWIKPNSDDRAADFLEMEPKMREKQLFHLLNQYPLSATRIAAHLSDGNDK